MVLGGKKAEKDTSFWSESTIHAEFRRYSKRIRKIRRVGAGSYPRKLEGRGKTFLHGDKKVGESLPIASPL